VVLQMQEMWLSNERLVYNWTPSFLTNDGDLTEQPSIVRVCHFYGRFILTDRDRISTKNTLYEGY